MRSAYMADDYLSAFPFIPDYKSLTTTDPGVEESIVLYYREADVGRYISKRCVTLMD